MVNSTTNDLQINNNEPVRKKLNRKGSVSKTHDRKLKPISFCLSNKDDVSSLDKLKKIKYGLYFKKILKHMSESELNEINKSPSKSEPLIPQSLINYNFKKGFLTCRKIAQLIVKENKVDILLNELKNFISDEFILELVKDRNLLLVSTDSNNQYLSAENLSIGSNDHQTSVPPKVFNKTSIEQIREIVRKHENLPAGVEIDNDFIEQFISENPEVLSYQIAAF